MIDAFEELLMLGRLIPSSLKECCYKNLDQFFLWQSLMIFAHKLISFTCLFSTVSARTEEESDHLLLIHFLVVKMSPSEGNLSLRGVDKRAHLRAT